MPDYVQKRQVAARNFTAALVELTAALTRAATQASAITASSLVFEDSDFATPDMAHLSAAILTDAITELDYTNPNSLVYYMLANGIDVKFSLASP